LRSASRSIFSTPLDAARRAGLDLPSVCEQGWDLACAVKFLSGILDHSDAATMRRTTRPVSL
jgi:ferredoxin